MSRDIVPLGLRMPPDLKERIEAASKQNGRSMNAEIVARLQASFDPRGIETTEMAHAAFAAATLAVRAALKLLKKHPEDDATQEAGIINLADTLLSIGTDVGNAKHTLYSLISSGKPGAELRWLIAASQDEEEEDVASVVAKRLSKE